MTSAVLSNYALARDFTIRAGAEVSVERHRRSDYIGDTTAELMMPLDEALALGMVAPSAACDLPAAVGPDL